MNNKSKIELVVVLIAIVLIGITLFLKLPTKKAGPADYKTASYTIDGKSTSLLYFGNEARGDLNGDGVEDIAFLATQDGGGSGTFYYVVVALGGAGTSVGGYFGTNGILLGDRIAPQTTEIRDGLVIVNYAERAAGEPMTTRPSVGVSKYLFISNGTLVENKKHDLVQVTSPRPNAEISSPLTITGQARGTWYFEASFPVALVDWDGKIIAQGIAQAQSDWMSPDFVPFIAKLTFKTADIPNGYSNKGTLILKKDNPSGLPEHDDALEIPIIFK